jgi:hypothetical protein
MLNTISDDTLTFDPLHKIPPTSHTNEYSDSTLEQDITYFNQYQHEGNPKIGDGIIEEQKSSSFKGIGGTEENDINDIIGYQDNESNNNEYGDDESVFEEESCSCTILKQWKERKNRPDHVISDDYVHSTKLAKLLHTANAPLYMFDSIMSWASEATMNNYKFPIVPLSREKYYQNISTNYGMNGIKPEIKELQLPSSGRIVEVISFDIEQLLLSILSNKELMSVDNLLFENGNPFSLPKRRISKVGDVNSGSWYINAYKNLCHHPKDVLVPIIFFIDGVTIDMYSHLNLEPVTFTLGIFNRDTRNRAYS